METSLRYDHYEILTRSDGSLWELGRGAMGITYKARDVSLRTLVAIKVINPAHTESETSRARFIREAQSAARLRHPNIATVFYLGTKPGAWFYAMEYVDGETVEALIRRQGPLGLKLALNITEQAARALGAAAACGLVHRDIKPANLMLARENDELVIKVIDFGLVKPSDNSEEATMLSQAGFVGTPRFSSPEQLSEGTVDVRSDIYSLGITLWFMLTGQTPFGGTLAAVVSQQLQRPPPIEQIPNLPPAAAGLLKKMLEKSPEQRPQNISELRELIEACLNAATAEIESLSPDQSLADEEENFPTIADHATQKLEVWETGATIGLRYLIKETLGETPHGTLFSARHMTSRRDVRLHVFRAGLITSETSRKTLRAQVDRLEQIEHPNILRFRGMDTLGGRTLVITDPLHGATLKDILRTRRTLKPTEAIHLGKATAAALEQMLAVEIYSVNISLESIHLHTSRPLSTPETTLATPLENWPEYQLKLDPLIIIQEPDTQATWDGGQTIASHGIVAATTNDQARQEFIKAIALLTYELTNGSLPPDGKPHPVAAFSEKQNQILATALSQPGTFSGPSEWIETFRSGALPPTTDQTPTAAPPPQPPASQPAPRPQTPPRTPHNKTKTLLISTGAAALIAAAIIITRPNKPTPNPQQPIAETKPPAPTPEPPPQPTPLSPQPPPPVVAKTDFQTELSRAESLAARSRWKESLDTFTRLFDENPEGRNSIRTRVDLLFAAIDEEPAIITNQINAELATSLAAAANIGLVPAQVRLAKQLRTTDTAAAKKWFTKAATNGDATSYTSLGLLYSGPGNTEEDKKKAPELFQQAIEKGDPTAMLPLAELYETGRCGLTKDAARAFSLIQQLAETTGDARALSKLATYHAKGTGTKEDHTKAAQLYKLASDANFPEATRNLARLTLAGIGVKRDPATAIALLEKAASQRDAAAFFTLAQCYLDGEVVPKNPLLAREKMQKAAELGHREAEDWCRKNGVSF